MDDHREQNRGRIAAAARVGSYGTVMLVTIRYIIGILTWIKSGLIRSLLLSGVAERGLPLLSVPSSVQVADRTKHRGMSIRKALGECWPPPTQRPLRQ